MKVITENELRNLRKQLEETEALYISQQQSKRQDVIAQLNGYAQQLESIKQEAVALAESVGLVFSYSHGYDEWCWNDSANWQSSSYC